MLPLHTQKSLDRLTWNEIQKLHAALGLKATAATRSRRDYQRRIVAAQPQQVVEPEHTATALTCQACPFAILLEDNRYKCGAGVTGGTTRGHWEAITDCYEAVAQTQTEATELVAEVEAPIVQAEEVPATPALIATELIAETAVWPQSAWPQPAWYIEMMTEIREYQKSLPDVPKPSKLYTKLCLEMEVGDYLKTDYEVTRRRTQVVAAKEVLADGRIHFILNCGISHREIFSQEVWLEAPTPIVQVEPEETPVAKEIEVAIVPEAQIAPEEMPALTDTTFTKIIFQGQVYTLIGKPEGHIERSSLVVASNSVIGVVIWAGRACGTLNQWRIVYEELVAQTSSCKNLTEILSEGHEFYRLDQFQGMSVYYGNQPIPELTLPAVPLIAQLASIAPKHIATTTDDAPPNPDDNGCSRISAAAPVTEASVPATIAQTPRAKQDDNFMTAFIVESDADREFNDINYLLELQTKAQLEIERTVIGSEDEAIAYRYLRGIERDIEFYGRPHPEPQPSPVIAQLEIQMAGLKDQVKQYTIDTSILTLADEPEPVSASLDSEGTIYWETPLRGTIVGKKGVKRSFYLRNRDYFGGDKNCPTAYDIYIIMSAEFTASESKCPNIRHQQIREAVEVGRTFNPIAFKHSPQFESATEDCDGIGRIMQGCDGRWWAWAIDGLTGHSFADRTTACKYLEKVSQNQRQKFAQESVACMK